MRRIIFIVCFSVFLGLKSNSQSSSVGAICLPTYQNNSQSGNWIPGNSRSTSDLKIVRVNIHFNLTSSGTGNFRANDDGLGNASYTGYDYARRLIEMCNWFSFNNVQMNIPPGNTTAVLDKNIRWVLDAVIFRNNDTYYTYSSGNAAADHNLHGVDGQNVMNIYLRMSSSVTATGNASNISPNSNVKYTANAGFWEGYKALIDAGGSITDPWWHPYVVHLNHELFHCHTLSHTIRYNGLGGGCPTNCSNLENGSPPDPTCEGDNDGCADTPSAWEIAQLNGCTVHPNCAWGDGSDMWCTNNVMDYTGDNALTPCQINRIHSALEGGLRPYLACDAVLNNLTICDIGYPKLSYFGKDVSIGCTSTAANLTAKEKVDVYTSNFVELTNFEVATDAAFEVYHLPVCGF